jgi:hypothetical protein
LLIGFLWLLLDLINIPGMVRSDREKIRRRERARLERSKPAPDAAARSPGVEAALISQLMDERSPV